MIEPPGQLRRRIVLKIHNRILTRAKLVLIKQRPRPMHQPAIRIALRRPHALAMKPRKQRGRAGSIKAPYRERKLLQSKPATSSKNFYQHLSAYQPAQTKYPIRYTTPINSAPIQNKSKPLNQCHPCFICVKPFRFPCPKPDLYPFPKTAFVLLSARSSSYSIALNTSSLTRPSSLSLKIAARSVRAALRNISASCPPS